MGIGVGIFLIAVGAVLAFAVDYQISGLDIAVVGWILMIVGLAGLILTAFIWAPRRRRSTAGATVEERTIRPRPPEPG